MRTLLHQILFLSLANCAAVDQLDGHIDNQKNCCAELTHDAIQECLVANAPADHDGWCWEAFCSAPVGKVSAELSPEGEIISCEPE